MKGEKILPEIYQGEPAEPGKSGAERAKEAAGEKQGAKQANNGKKLKGEIGGADEPCQRGKVERGEGGRERRGYLSKKRLGRKNAVRTEEAWELGQEREESKKITHAEEAGKKPEADGGFQEKRRAKLKQDRDIGKFKRTDGEGRLT